MEFGNGLRQRLLSAVAVGVVSAWAGPVQAEPREERVQLSIEALPLGEALRAFSEQTGRPVLFSDAQVAGLSAVPVEGVLAPEAALARLLEGSGLEAVGGAGDTIVIRTRQAAPLSPEAAPPQEEAVRTVPDRATGPDQEEGALRIGTVKVTGTSLRGIAPESSPLQVYDRDDILNSGVTSTEQFIRTLPQNFGGGSSEFAAGGLPGDRNSAQNYSFGTGANLRGLGSRGTLVLLNGNRLAPTSAIGDFVDLSLIPVSALDRVDVLTDGASSIYGGDAVAGVINFVLRDDFEGAETSLRYGSVTDGDMSEYRFGQTLGGAWGSGNAIATYEFYSRDDLSLADRPELAAPALRDGAPILNRRPFDLLPEQERNSAMLSVNQKAGSKLRLSGTALWSRRDVYQTTVYAGTTAQVNSSDTRSESLALNLGADYDLPAGWLVSADLTYNEVKNDERLATLVPVEDAPVLSDFDSDLLSFDLQLDGDLFRLPGGPVRAALGGQVREETFFFGTRGFGTVRDGSRDVTAAYGELLIPLVGEDNARPGLERLELSLSGRYDDYSDFGDSANPKVGLVWVPVEGLRLRGSWSESFAPPTVGQSGALDRVAIVQDYDFIRDLYGIDLPDPSLAGVSYMTLNGTGDALEPETSRTFTAGLDYDLHMGIHSWSLRSSYYDIDFDGRLGRIPIPGNLNPAFAPALAYDDPDLFPDGMISFLPDSAEVDSALAALSRPVILANGGRLDNIGIISRVNQTRNLASTETSGLDIQLNWSADTRAGTLSAGLNANYIIDFTQKAAPNTPDVETLNTLYNPVDLHLRGNAGIRLGDVSATLFINHVASYRTDDTVSGQRVGDWTTADLTLSYAPDAPALNWAEGTAVSLSVQNLFDEAPPRTPPLSSYGLTGYDPANASPVGRFVAVELRKQF
ncbi:TonB-dependent receptor [Henriciella aquimarina]|uniref:TonB-dependent receptor n=1 Tax=Henriciella aquimarina TaxID=545261 RepID=UPI0009FD7D62|nr:TonB-dependent receptor [Henriciella aquimarina]